ncbi:MAG: signal peptidase I [Defluviitaleaceae bacterium]|nr:signal peptidase I [Defluviitaleaceae bacterium]
MEALSIGAAGGSGASRTEIVKKFAPIVPIEIDLGFAHEARKEPQNGGAKKRGGFITTVSDAMFSVAVIMVLFIAVVSGAESGGSRKIFGYSFFTVISPSMQDEIPINSFILVKHIEPGVLKEGDNITYMAGIGATVTHKVIRIYENYDGAGGRGFQTKGTENPSPDPEIVEASSVVGKVVLVLPVLGAAMKFMSDNVFAVFVIFCLCMPLSFFLRGAFAGRMANNRIN